MYDTESRERQDDYKYGFDTGRNDRVRGELWFANGDCHSRNYMLGYSDGYEGKPYWESLR